MARGPSYPYVGLEEAIGYARKVYDHAKRGSSPAESVVTDALGYSITSSSGQKVLAALKAFGFIEDSPGSNGKSIKVTGRAIRILLDDQDSEERRDEIQKAVLSPKWYEYLWKKWGKDMPPAMKSDLLIEHGFVDSTVEGFLNDYRKSIAFAGLLDNAILSKNGKSEDQSGTRPKIGDYIQWESQGVLRMPAARKLTHYSPEGDFAFVEGELTGIPAEEMIAVESPLEQTSSHNLFIPAFPKTMERGGPMWQRETFALPEGVTGQLQWPSEMSPEAFEDFVYQLEGLKRRVNRAIRKA